MTEFRSHSPRFPIWDLATAMAKTKKLYEAHKNYKIDSNVVAKSLGYKDATNGSAKKTIACLGYYGLISVSKGCIAVSKEFVNYLVAPDEKTQHEFVLSWVGRPPIFNKLLTEYASGLPSAELIVFWLVLKHNFNEGAAKRCAQNFIASYALLGKEGVGQENITRNDTGNTAEEEISFTSGGTNHPQGNKRTIPIAPDDRATDTILIRLQMRRKSHLKIPNPFFEADKAEIIRVLQGTITDEEPPALSSRKIRAAAGT